jgi:hypothetical protein
MICSITFRALIPIVFPNNQLIHKHEVIYQPTEKLGLRSLQCGCQVLEPYLTEPLNTLLKRVPIKYTLGY